MQRKNPGAEAPGFCRPRSGRDDSESDHVSGLRTFGARLDVEFDGGVFGDGLEARLRQGAEVKEDVGAAVIALDETETFVLVKPLHLTLCSRHTLFPCQTCTVLISEAPDGASERLFRPREPFTGSSLGEPAQD